MKDEVKVLDHATTDFDTAIQIIDKQLKETRSALEELEKQKAEFQTQKIIASFEEGKYYRLAFGCEYYYFRFTKANFYVKNMEGTVGYNGENKVVIQHGVKVFATMACYSTGIFHTVYLPLDIFESMYMKEVSEEEYKEECKQAIEYLKQEASID